MDYRFPCIILLLAGFAAAQTPPRDIYKETGNRLPPINREALSSRARTTYDQAASTTGSAPRGVAGIRLHVSGSNAQYEGSAQELAEIQLAILAAAREQDQPFEWTLHEMQAMILGLDIHVIDVVRNRQPFDGLSEKHADIIQIQIARETLGRHHLTSETYARALKTFGEPRLVDIITQMTGYAGPGATLTAFNQQMPVGWRQSLPLPFTQPADVHPDSRNRLSLSKNVNARSATSLLYQRTLTPEGTGPVSIQMHGGGQKSLEASVGQRTISLVTLATARALHSQYEWTMNEPVALTNGLEPAVIDIVRKSLPLNGLSEKDGALIAFVREMYSQHYVSAETYARAEKAFGERDLVDLVSVMGQHAGNADLLAAFNQQLPENTRPLLPTD